MAIDRESAVAAFQIGWRAACDAMVKSLESQGAPADVINWIKRWTTVVPDVLVGESTDPNETIEQAFARGAFVDEPKVKA